MTIVKAHIAHLAYEDGDWLLASIRLSLASSPVNLSEHLPTLLRSLLLNSMRPLSLLCSPHLLFSLMTVAVAATSPPLGAEERALNPDSATSKGPSVLYSIVPGCTLSYRSELLRSYHAHTWLSPWLSENQTFIRVNPATTLPATTSTNPSA